MATHQVTPHPSQPQPFPKPALYEAIAALNRDLGTVIDDFNRLREFRFSRLYIDAFIVKIEDLRSWANAEFLERQHDRELKDWYHFGRLDRKFEQRFKDPNDVLIDAEHRLQQLAAEERDALAEAHGLRKRRRRAEKQLLPPTN
jgi:hypothetical protein